MKQLISTESPKYLRRLVREVNNAFLRGCAVYAIDSIDAKADNFRVFNVSYAKFCGSALACNNSTRFARRFFDGNGNEICASRE